MAFSACLTPLKVYILNIVTQLEITEDADVSKFLTISIRVQGQEEGPFERQKAPHAGEIEAPWVGRSCVKINNIEIQNITFSEECSLD